MDLAEKYRPRSLKDLVGQSVVIKQIQGILKQKVYPSTVHIHGPSGFGKTSTAKVLAALYEGVESPADLTEDVKELNVGAQSGIENIRKLAQESLFKPVKLPFRIFILDEVHALTSSSSNAILKVLEKPCPTTKFFLITNQPQKLLPTIKRRGITLTLQAPENKDLLVLVRKVCKREKVDLDLRICKLIVKESRQSPATCLNILEQVLLCAAGGGTVKEQVSVISTATDTDEEVIIFNFIKSCYTKDIKKTMGLLYENKIDIVSFCTRAMDVHARMFWFLESQTDPDTSAMTHLVNSVSKNASLQTKQWLHFSLADLRMKALNGQVIPDNHDLLAILLKQGAS